MMADVLSATMQMQKEQSIKSYTTAELVKELSTRKGVKCQRENDLILLIKEE